MKFLYLRENTSFTIDGKTASLSEIEIDDNIWALHWDDSLQEGWIEYVDSTPNLDINSLDEFENYLSVFNNYFDSINNSLDFKKNEKLSELQFSFNKELNSGFNSDALGDTHKYDSELHNRENIIGAKLSGQDLIYTCDNLEENENSKIQRMHTSSQINQVFLDGLSFKENLISKLRSKRISLDSALSIEEVEGISWDD